jgi:hypothetical protein
LALVSQLRISDVTPETLAKSVQAARQAVVAQNYNFNDLANGLNPTATSKGDLYNVAPLKSAGAKARIEQFGLQGEDALVVFGYSKSTSTQGDNRILEFSVTQQGADTAVFFELAPDSLGTSTGFIVTLTGVDASILTYADHLILG